MKPMLLFLLSNSMFFTMFAQKGNVEQKEAMKKLHWMTGDWSGFSTVAVNGQKRSPTSGNPLCRDLMAPF